MPLYDYKCATCNIKVELIRAINATEKPLCDLCGSVMLQVYSAPAIQFKGTGWASKEKR